MLDIETLGTASNSVVVQIGCCMFDRLTGEIPLNDRLLININIDSCLKKGLVVSGGTIEFWLKQEGRSFLDKPIAITVALEQLKSFYQRQSMFGKNPIYTWSHASFDIPIIESAFSACGIISPFKYFNCRDIRTLTDIGHFDIKKDPEYKTKKTHNALEDCLYQVQYCVPCLQRIENSIKA
jgi:hypothetical protein